MLADEKLCFALCMLKISEKNRLKFSRVSRFSDFRDFRIFKILEILRRIQKFEISSYFNWHFNRSMN